MSSRSQKHRIVTWTKMAEQSSDRPRISPARKKSHQDRSDDHRPGPGAPWHRRDRHRRDGLTGPSVTVRRGSHRIGGQGRTAIQDGALAARPGCKSRSCIRSHCICVCPHACAAVSIRPGASPSAAPSALHPAPSSKRRIPPNATGTTGKPSATC